MKSSSTTVLAARVLVGSQHGTSAFSALSQQQHSPGSRLPDAFRDPTTTRTHAVVSYFHSTTETARKGTNTQLWGSLEALPSSAEEEEEGDDRPEEALKGNGTHISSPTDDSEFLKKFQQVADKYELPTEDVSEDSPVDEVFKKMFLSKEEAELFKEDTQILTCGDWLRKFEDWDTFMSLALATGKRFKRGEKDELLLYLSAIVDQEAWFGPGEVINVDEPNIPDHGTLPEEEWLNADMKVWRKDDLPFMVSF